tara:strand:+ start:412 stop:726 length:315 start_codon:yes stop_codon:yes gene_type:complete
MRLTIKQYQLIMVVGVGNKHDDGSHRSWCDLDEILDRLPYETTKQSLQFSIRALIKKGMIIRGDRELLRGRMRRKIVPTQMAFEMAQTVSIQIEDEAAIVEETW